MVNKIGCKDENDAIKKLIVFWKEYRQCTLQMDRIMPDVIKEFYIINDFKAPYTEITKEFPIKTGIQAEKLKGIIKGIYSDKMNFLSDISTYKIVNSKLLETQYGYLLNQCIEKVFTRIHKEFEVRDISLPELLIHKNMTEYWWRPLMDYNVYGEEEKPDKTIIVEGIEKYERKNGQWSRTRYSAQREYKNIIGYILKTMECYIREYLGYRKLKLPDKKEILKDIDEYYCSAKKRALIHKIYKIEIGPIIESETMGFLHSNKIPKMVFRKPKNGQNEFEQEEKVEVVFNQDKFAKIRAKSEEIQRALIVEENEDSAIIESRKNDMNNQKSNAEQADKTNENVNQNAEEKIKIFYKNEQTYKEIASNIQQGKETSEYNDLETKGIASIQLKNEAEQQNTKEDNVFKKFTFSLTPKEKEVVQTLLEKQDVENRIAQIAKGENEMLEVMISNINDKALETIGDTVIESDMTSIYEDYEKEIKQSL